MLSTHGEQEEFGRQPTGSVETVDINAPFGFDTILNFTAAVGVGGVSEVQTIDFNGQVNQRPGTPDGPDRYCHGYPAERSPHLHDHR
ncbi:MAG: hypothetical protein IPK97_18060 [Ahniella sp.]|nr:hypothetical protein [Ahniella sp.]